MIKYIIIGAIAVIVIAVLLVVILKNKNSKSNYNDESADIGFSSEDKERLTFQKTQIKIDFLKDTLLNTISHVEKCYYTMDTNVINNLSINEATKNKIIADIQREISIGIKKQLTTYVVVEDKFKSFQDNKMMYAVSKIDVEVPFYVDYLYFHATVGQKHIQKYYIKKFEFINIKNNWYLNDIKSEQILNIDDYNRYLEEKKNQGTGAFR